MPQKRADVPVQSNPAEDTANRPLSEQIAALAHALWYERGCPEGSPEEDWFKADQEIRKQRTAELVHVLQNASGGGAED
jgi:hypothetical protein